jgi:hypothetical protein
MTKEAYEKIEAGLIKALALVEAMPFNPGFGIHGLIDWDKEAMTEIEGIRSCAYGKIDRKPSQYWRSTRYGASETEGE